MPHDSVWCQGSIWQGLQGLSQDSELRRHCQGCGGLGWVETTCRKSTLALCNFFDMIDMASPQQLASDENLAMAVQICTGVQSYAQPG